MDNANKIIQDLLNGMEKDNLLYTVHDKSDDPELSSTAVLKPEVKRAYMHLNTVTYKERNQPDA